MESGNGERRGPGRSKSRSPAKSRKFAGLRNRGPAVKIRVLIGFAGFCGTLRDLFLTPTHTHARACASRAHARAYASVGDRVSTPAKSRKSEEIGHGRGLRLRDFGFCGAGSPAGSPGVSRGRPPPVPPARGAVRAPCRRAPRRRSPRPPRQGVGSSSPRALLGAPYRHSS